MIVPFAGAEHDWSAIELGAWFSLGATAAPARGRSDERSGVDASRLLANASLAVQRAFGVHAEPLLVEPAVTRSSPRHATPRSSSSGSPTAGDAKGSDTLRTALAASPHHPTLLVRRGFRPGGLGPADEPDPLHLDDRAET